MTQVTMTQVTMTQVTMTQATSDHESRRARQLERLRFWRRACAERSPDLAAFGLAAGERPLVFFHGDYEAGGTYVTRLAAAFGRPLVSIGPHGLHGDPVPPTVEAMAADRMALVLSACPSGPFRLGGYCNGAIVAYETARQLAEAGHAVAGVVLVEPPSLSVHPGYRALHAALARLAGRLARLPGGDADRLLGRMMRRVGRLDRLCTSTRRELRVLALTRLRRLSARWRRSADAPTEAERRRDALYDAYARVLPAYLPPHTAFPVTVLSSGKDAAGRTCGLYDGPGWRHVCAAFHHVRLEGSHLSCLMETTGHVARLMQDALDGPPQQAPPPRPAPDPAPAAWRATVLNAATPFVPMATVLGGLIGADPL